MWEQIRSNQTRSAILVAVMAVLFLLIGYFFGLLFFESGTGGLIIALLVWAIMSLIAYLEGDAILLALSGARKINRDDHPRLYNIVEEMKLASGLEAMPEVYIIDDPSPNAFATGRDPKKASVAVTSGLLQKLNRDELQGVIGHEMAHIQNRDVLLMAICSVLLGSIVILAWYGPRILLSSGGSRTRRSSSSGGGGLQVILLVVAVLLMILAPILARLIFFAISRRREYLADASSALYTRYPQGLASALEKIAASPIQLKSANNATAPMYILNPFRKKDRAASDLTSTHPPISQRIRILRSMAGASFADYEEAYQRVRGAKKGIIPTSAVAAAKSVSLRAAATAEAEEGAALDEVERARETSDLMWRMGKYKTIDCECGTKLRVPPSYSEPSIACPHCGRINPV